MPPLKRVLRGALCAGLLAATSVFAGVAHDPDLTWRTVRTPHFHIHFHDGLHDLALRAADIAERVHQRLSVQLHWSPSRPTDIVLTDEVDFANGFTTPFPGNHIELWVTPPDEGLDEFGSWLDALITHEYVHVLHLDAVDRTPAAWRTVFGRHPLLFPNALQPDWVVEGLATHLEGDEQSATGRGQSAYFDMLMRMEVASGVKPLRQVNLPIDTWPAGATRYLYGVKFMQFVADRYGDVALDNWITRYRGNLIPFMINTNSRRVFKRTLSEMWDEYAQWLRGRYEPELAHIAAQGVREGEALTFSGYGTGSTLVGADGSIFFVRADGRTPVALAAIRSGRSTTSEIAELNPGARFDVHPRAGFLIAQPERVGSARVYYDLYRLPFSASVPQRLTHGQRFRNAVWNPSGNAIYAVKQAEGTSSLHLLNDDGSERAVLWQGAEDEVLSAVAVNPQGTSLIASMWRRESGWQLAEFELSSRVWRLFPQRGVTPLAPRYTSDGTAVLYSADIAGVYNIWRLDLAHGTQRQVTRVRGGAFSPSEDARGNVVYTGYTGRGYDVFRLRADQHVVAENEQPVDAALELTPRPVSPETARPAFDVTPYAPATGLAPTWWSPLWAVTDDLFLVGATTSGTDPLRRHNYTVTGAFDFENNLAVGEAAYGYDGWPVIPEVAITRDIGLHRAPNDTLAAVTTDNAIGAALTWPFLKQRTQWLLSAGTVYERQRVEWTAPAVSYRTKKTNALAGVALRYNSTMSLPLSISRGFGRDVSLVYEDSDIGPSDYPGRITFADWQEFFNPGGEHVIGLRYAFGWGEGDPRPFELGGALSTADVLGDGGTGLPFDRRDFALRGYKEGLAALKGRRMELMSAEWRVPISRVERGFMAPPVGLHQWYATLFTDVGDAWNQGHAPEKRYVGTGIELNFETSLFYRARIDIVLGYAHGWDDKLGEDQAYLRLGAAF